jgi:glycogen operon protein
MTTETLVAPTPVAATAAPASASATGRPAATIGAPAPLGATLRAGGVNFSLFSRDATAIDLALFDAPGDARPSRVMSLDPLTHRTYHYWHCFVPGLKAGQVYAYRAHGRFDPGKGLRFDPSKLLLDPYGRGVIVPQGYERDAGKPFGVDNAATAMKSVVVDPTAYDWGDDAPPRHPPARTIVYEMHVRGFTRHPSSGVAEPTRGTYAGLIEKIPYLKDLGITAVELLPVFQYDAQDCPCGVVNYWGYQPVSFFAPHQAYSSRQGPGEPVNEFRDMVKALHRAGIEVILDVVFNHTSEGGMNGPTFCFRGLDNPTYYILDPKDPGRYADYSGCGNTLNANNPVVRRMIVDSIRYWVKHMHVDGFRFDLASILSRDSSGNVLPNPPVLWDLESDPALAGVKLFAEAWDAAGLYQVGSFVGDSWREWNGRFRDDARSFFRSDNGSAHRFADRMLGSPEIYGHKDREPEQSVNFVTCHDGFTLNDLVSYNQKHNQANNDENRDGANDNFSWNCGVEGPCDDPAVERLRERQIRNFFAATLLSVGLPMIVMGDEVRRTQHGNNNGYCHDDDSTWFDWTLVHKNPGLLRFVSKMIARRAQRTLRHEKNQLSLTELIRTSYKEWHGVKLKQPDWGDGSHTISFTAEVAGIDMFVQLIFNAYWEPLAFELPQEGKGARLAWRRWIDTSLDSPNDIVDWQDAPAVANDYTYRAEARSVVVLIADSSRRTT